MLTDPRKINPTIDAILSACVKRFMRRSQDGENERTNKQTHEYINPSLYNNNNNNNNNNNIDNL